MSFLVYRVINILGINRNVTNLNDDTCQIVGDIYGPEDFHIFNDRFFITISDEKLKLFVLKGYTVENTPEGGLHLNDLDSKTIKR